MRTSITLALTVLILSSTACYKTVYHLNAQPQARSQRYDEHWHIALIYGIIEAEEVDLDLACASYGEPALLVDRTSFLNSVVGSVINSLTFFVVPLVEFREVSVYCGEGLYGGAPGEAY